MTMQPEEKDSIPFPKTVIIGWHALEREHQRAASEFFMSALEEQGLDPKVWQPNVTQGIMSFVRIPRAMPSLPEMKLQKETIAETPPA